MLRASLNASSTHILAVDGGGSKTLARLSTKDGESIGEARGGPANVFQDRERAARQILDLWHQLRNGIDPASVILAAGLAGLEAPGARSYLAETFSAFQDRIIVSDADATFHAAFDDRPGCLIICGTGVAAMIRRDPGEPAELKSGWGFPIHDQGSGAWLGAELVRRYLNHRDGYPTPSSPLLKAVEVEIGSHREQILGWLEQARPADFARLVPAIIGAGDPLAHSLLASAIDRIEELARCLGPDKHMPLRMAGGLAAVIEPALRTRLGDEIMPDMGPIDPLDGLLAQALKRIS